MAVYTLGVIQLLSIIAIIVYEFNKKSIVVFMWATLLVMFGIPHLISIMIGTSGYDENIMINASIFVIIFNIIYITNKIFLYNFSNNNGFFWGTNQSNKVSASTIKVSIKIRRICFSLLLLSLITLLTYLKKYLGSISNIYWGNIRAISSGSGYRSLLTYAQFLLMVGSGVILIYLRSRKFKMAMISIFIVLIYSLLTGNRWNLLPVLTSIFLDYIYIKNKKLNIKTIITLSIMGFLGLYLVYFVRLARHNAGIYNILINNSLSEINKKNLDLIFNGDGELGLRKAFYHFLYYDNNFANFNRGHTYIRLLLIAIPTSLIPGIKPTDFAISMGSAWLMDPYNNVFSMHPTLYGDCFANLWWFGVFLGLFWALFSYLVDKLINKQKEDVKILLMVAFSTAFTIAGRGSVYNGFFMAFVVTIITMIINLLSRVTLYSHD